MQKFSPKFKKNRKNKSMTFDMKKVKIDKSPRNPFKKNKMKENSTIIGAKSIM